MKFKMKMEALRNGVILLAVILLTLDHHIKVECAFVKGLAGAGGIADISKTARAANSATSIGDMGKSALQQQSTVSEIRTASTAAKSIEGVDALPNIQNVNKFSPVVNTDEVSKTAQVLKTDVVPKENVVANSDEVTKAKSTENLHEVEEEDVLGDFMRSINVNGVEGLKGWRPALKTIPEGNEGADALLKLQKARQTITMLMKLQPSNLAWLRDGLQGSKMKIAFNPNEVKTVASTKAEVQAVKTEMFSRTLGANIFKSPYNWRSMFQTMGKIEQPSKVAQTSSFWNRINNVFSVVKMKAQKNLLLVKFFGRAQQLELVQKQLPMLSRYMKYMRSAV